MFIWGVCFSRLLFDSCLCFSLYPESPRWLYAQGRRKEMNKLILKAASINRVKISEDFIEHLSVPTKAESKVPFYKLFSHRVLAIRTIVLYINW